MALVKRIDAVSVTQNEQGGKSVTFRLVCAKTAIGVDDVIDQEFTAYVKGNVEGKTQNDLIDEAVTKVQGEMQAVIDKYLAEDALLNSAKLANVIAAMEAALTTE